MSFFYDFLDYFKIDDISKNIAIMAVLGKGVMIVGKLEITNIGDDFIEIKSGKDKVCISGKNLIVKTLSKGEILLSGKIEKIETGVLWTIV